MRILDVKIAERKTDEATGCHGAFLSLKTDTGGINLRATAELEGKPSPDRVMESLISDVVRQLKSLPEYRNGKNPIVVDENASVEFV